MPRDQTEKADPQLKFLKRTLNAVYKPLIYAQKMHENQRKELRLNEETSDLQHRTEDDIKWKQTKIDSGNEKREKETHRAETEIEPIFRWDEVCTGRRARRKVAVGDDITVEEGRRKGKKEHDWHSRLL